MATQISTQGSLAPELQTFYDRNLLERAKPYLVHNQFGQKKSIPKRKGAKTIQFRRFANLAVATTPLTEGVTPAGNSLSVSEITADIAQYGDFIEISDVLDLVAVDPILVETGELLGDQAGETMDALTREVISAGTNVQYANGRLSRVTVAAGDNLTVDEIRKAVRTLKRAKGKGFSGYFVAIVEPGTTYDLQSDTKWQDAQKYAQTKRLFDGEIGEIYGVRFVETTEAKKFAGAGAAGIDVYSTLVIAQNAYGVIDIEGGGLENIVKGFGSAGTGDPLNQRSTSGWKAMHTAKILNDTWMVRIEHAVTA